MKGLPQLLLMCAWHWLLPQRSGIGVDAFSLAATPFRHLGRGQPTTISSRTRCQSYTDPTIAVTVAETVQPFVVLVTPKGVRNMTNRGSGFLLAEDDLTRPLDLESGGGTYLITAAHVAAPGYTIEITLPTTTTDQGEERNTTTTTTTTFPATVVARNTTLDLALLWTKESLRVVVKGEQTHNDSDVTGGLTLSRDVPPVGTLAFAHGHPASRLRGPAMTSGIVCGIADGLGVPDILDRRRRSPRSSQSQEEDEGASNTTGNNTIAEEHHDVTMFVVTDAAMSGGMSGGPLVDSTGVVLGVNALIRPDLRALGNYAVSSLEVLDFLQSIPPRQLSSSSTTTGSDAASVRNEEVKVWLYNDPMNKKARVSGILNSVALLDDDKAKEVMMQAHTTGRGMVGNYMNRSTAESIYRSLREQDLLVEME